MSSMGSLGGGSGGNVSLSGALPVGTNTIGNVDQTLATAGFDKLTDGINTVSIKSASTAPVATDPALVVAISPNTPPLAVNLDIGGSTVSTSNPVYMADAYMAPTINTWTNTTVLNTAITMNTAGNDTVALTINPTGTITAGAVTFEVYDGAAWFAIKCARLSSYNTDSTFSAIGATLQSWTVPVAGFPQFRVRLSTALTGTSPTLVITAIVSSAPDTSIVTVGMDPAAPLPAGTNVLGQINATMATRGYEQITDGTNAVAVKAASTAAVAADPALVVALSPNNNTTTNALFIKHTDGTNTAAVKAASTAAVASDPASVVTLSPNTALPAGANTIGVVNQGTAASLTNAWAEKLTDGTNGPVAVKAASTNAVATDPSLVVSLSPNNFKTSAYSVAWPANITVVAVKASAGIVYSLVLCNNATSARSFKIYDVSQASVVVGTTAPKLAYQIPASSTITAEFGPYGITFSTAISVVATGTTTFADTTSTTANDVVVSVNYL